MRSKLSQWVMALTNHESCMSPDRGIGGPVATATVKQWYAYTLRFTGFFSFMGTLHRT
jgi:hypothetical protein